MATALFKPSMPEDFFSQDVKNVCRICLQTDYTLETIFKNDVDEMISEFLPKKVDLKDEFPHKICGKCAEDVRIAYAFKKQAEYSYDVIKNMLDGKRLPRAANKASYKEIGEEKVYRTTSIPEDFYNTSTGMFRCHICYKYLTTKSILKRHLKQIHNFHEFEECEAYKKLFEEKQKPVHQTPQKVKQPAEDNFVEELTFPLAPQVILLDDYEENDDDDDFNETNDPFNKQNESPEKNERNITNNDRNAINNDKNATNNVVPQNDGPLVYDCHICHKRLTRRYYLRCHLERVHKFFGIDQLFPLRKPNQKEKDPNDSFKNLPSSSKAKPQPIVKPQEVDEEDEEEEEDDDDDEDLGVFECNICKNIFSRRHSLKKHYELVHNVNKNEIKRSIDLSFDYFNDDRKPISRPSLPKVAPPRPAPTPPKVSLPPRPTPPKPSPVARPPPKPKAEVKGQTPNTISVFICHICNKEFAARGTMRRHLKNVHKYLNFDDNVWLSKVYQKTIEPNDVRFQQNDDENADQSFNNDDDIDMHALLLCPEVVLTTQDDNEANENANNKNLKPEEIDYDDEIQNESKKMKHDNNDEKSGGEFKLGVLAVKEISPSPKPFQPKPQKTRKALFWCSFCNRPFDRRDHLRRHEQTHSKPFVCQFCKKGFYRQDLHDRHVKSAHSKEMAQKNLQMMQNQYQSSFNDDSFNYNNDDNDEFNVANENLDDENSYNGSYKDNENDSNSFDMQGHFLSKLNNKNYNDEDEDYEQNNENSYGSQKYNQAESKESSNSNFEHQNDENSQNDNEAYHKNGNIHQNQHHSAYT